MDRLKYIPSSFEQGRSKSPKDAFADTLTSSQQQCYNKQSQQDYHDQCSYTYTYQQHSEQQVDDMQLEEDYILKLKTQRQRIQKLERTSMEKDGQLQKEVQRSKQLLEEIQKLAQFVPYQAKYQDLLVQKQELQLQCENMFGELKEIKQQLADVVKQSTTRIDRLKQQIHRCNINNREIIQQMDEKLSQKTDQIKNTKSMLKHIQHQKQKQMKQLKLDQQKLINQLQQTIFSYEKQCSRCKQQIRNKDELIGDLQRSLQGLKKSHNQVKMYAQKCGEQYQQNQKQMLGHLSKTKHYLSQSKKVNQELKSQLHDYQLTLRKQSQNSQQLQKLVSQLKCDIKKSTQFYEQTIKKNTYQSSQQIKHAQLFIDQLKGSIEQLMQVKNCMLTQNRKLAAILKRKQDVQRQRKQILRTQFKEINRIQKVIDRLQ